MTIGLLAAALAIASGAFVGLVKALDGTKLLALFGLVMIAVGIALVTGLWGDFVAWVRDAFVSDVRPPI